ncbi:MAG: hypothetical protein HYX29_10375 [Solirubrobacterales bacterium]|nr:hypothetical protein [Solirubrobacterales bacterium]
MKGSARLLVSALVVMALALAFAVQSASAASAGFCQGAGGSGGGGGVPSLGPYGSCTGLGNSNLTKVRVETTVSATHCAVGKGNSDGSGPNTIPAACGTALVQQTPCVAPLRAFPKATNGTNSTIVFFGTKWYGSC